MAWLLGVKLAKFHLQKILLLQKRVLWLRYFSEPRAHAVPLFTSSKILPLNMFYFETVSSIMFDVSCLTVPTNISNLFTKAKYIDLARAKSEALVNKFII